MTTKISYYDEKQQITSVRLASASNVSGTYDNGNNGIGATIIIAASSLTIDSVACAVNDRVLLTNQTNAFENGIYDVISIDTVATEVLLKRSPDFQNINQIKPGYFIPVSAGTQLGGSVFTIIEPQINVVGTDSITLVNSSSTPDIVTLQNTGLRIYNPAGTFLNTIVPTSAITANRTFSLVTGDAARTLDISAANVTISAFVAPVLNAIGFTPLQTAIGIKSGISAPQSIGTTSATITATGLVGDDKLVVTLVSRTDVAASILTAIPNQLGNAIDVTFSTAPGANTSIAWIATTDN